MAWGHRVVPLPHALSLKMIPWELLGPSGSGGWGQSRAHTCQDCHFCLYETEAQSVGGWFTVKTGGLKFTSPGPRLKNQVWSLVFSPSTVRAGRLLGPAGTAPGSVREFCLKGIRWMIEDTGWPPLSSLCIHVPRTHNIYTPHIAHTNTPPPYIHIYHNHTHTYTRGIPICTHTPSTLHTYTQEEKVEAHSHS